MQYFFFFFYRSSFLQEMFLLCYAICKILVLLSASLTSHLNSCASLSRLFDHCCRNCENAHIAYKKLEWVFFKLYLLPHARVFKTFSNHDMGNVESLVTLRGVLTHSANYFVCDVFCAEQVDFHLAHHVFWGISSILIPSFCFYVFMFLFEFDNSVSFFTPKYCLYSHLCSVACVSILHLWVSPMLS